MGQPQLNTVLKRFLGKIDSGKKLYERANALKVDYSLHPKQARRVIELGFLSIVGSWEEFLGATFMRYLCGAQAPSGFAPTILAGAPLSKLEDAFIALFQQLKGRAPKKGRDFLSLTSVKKLDLAATYFFKNGDPYSRIVTPLELPLVVAQKIRNRVAHDSQKCISEFKRVAIAHRSTIYQGYSAGQLLLEQPAPTLTVASGASTAPTLFLAYADLYEKMAKDIVPT